MPRALQPGIRAAKAHVLSGPLHREMAGAAVLIGF
jgi:hypothetical protein